MKILIINGHSPQFNPEKRILLAPLYLGAVLKENGHDVTVIDVEKDKVNVGDGFDFQTYCEESIGNVMEVFRPDIVGISVHYSGVFNGAVEIARYVKSHDPGIVVVMGGQHPTIFCKSILERFPEIDYIIKGEGESTFPELIELIQSQSDCSCVDGLGYRKNGTPVENDKRHFIADLDSLPFPDYSLVRISDYHFDTTGWFNPKGHDIRVSFPLLTSRSCPNRCTFCSMFLVQGPKFRMRSAANVVDEIQEMMERYDQRYFSIVDDNFTLNRGRIMEICRLIKERGLDIQFDTTNGMEINHVTRELMDTLIETGFLRTFFAVESGSEYIRTQVMKKKLPQKKIYEAFDIIDSYGADFDYNVLFIIGFPQETRETLLETRRLIEELEFKKVAIGFAIPYPGTLLYQEVISNDLMMIPEDELLENPDLFNFSKTPLIRPFALDPEELIRFREEVYDSVNRKKNLKTDFGFHHSGAKTKTG